LGNRYYTLIASLPHLPKRFDELPRPPISRPRLESRLADQLRPEDAEVADDMIAYLRWARHTQEQTVEEVRDFCDGLLEKTGNRVLRAIVSSLMDMRTILVALRMRHKGMPAPGKDDEWGVGGLVETLRANWNVHDFHLGRIYPWVGEFADLMEKDETLALERRINEVRWDFLKRIGEGHYFTFEAVLVYLGRWDIIDRWTSYNPQAAAEKHARLVKEAIGEQARIFG